VRCEAVSELLLPAVVDDPGALDAAQADHVGQCLRCQAELAQYRRLRRTMAAMATEAHRFPGDLATDVLVGIDDALARRARHRTVAKQAVCLGGLAAATAAGVGGVLVLTTRRRPA
jgi:hypothetical protein